MEIQRALRGENIDFAASRTAKKAEPKATGTTRPSVDRLELTRDLVRTMEEQRVRLEALLNQPAGQEKKSNGILDMLDGAEAESEELDALSKQMKVQQKCLKIAMNIMKGKKVPPEDEKYLMENDPNGYKLAIAMRSMEKEDDEECESVLDDEDKKSGETSESGEAATAEASPSEGGEAVE